MSNENGIIIVAGATGYLGRSIMHLIESSSFEALPICRRTSDEWPNAIVSPTFSADELPFISGNIVAVINCVGLAHQHNRTPSANEFFHANSEIARQLARYSKQIGAKRFVHASSVSVYGSQNHRISKIDESMHCNPTDIYGQSKLQGELLIQAELTGTNVLHTLVRIPTLYGADDPGNYSALSKLIKKKLFIFPGSGKNIKSICYIKDIAAALFRIATAKPTQLNNYFEVYNGPCQHLTLAKIVKEFAKIHRVKAPHFLPLVIENMAIYFTMKLGAFYPKIKKIAIKAKKVSSNEVFDDTLINETYGPFMLIPIEVGFQDYRAS